MLLSLSVFNIDFFIGIVHTLVLSPFINANVTFVGSVKNAYSLLSFSCDVVDE